VYDEFTKGTRAAAQGLKDVGDEAKKTSTTAGRDWNALGKKVSDLGSSMTQKVTLPIVGLGVVATKMSADFDNAFTQMQTLAGVSADEVDGLKESVLDLAGETGKAPQELAEAMYFLQSSGLDAAGAMDALEISAKASAAGLGETQVLADAVSSTMLAYADSNMTAAEAMDTLVATARAGKAEPAAIAGQLSKLIPVAAALDISFQDVGGALAALSTKSFSAEQGATGLAAVMAKLMKPSQQAQEQLDAVGLSGDRLGDLLSEKGLLGTLTTLKERLGDNGFEMFLEDQQAINAGIALTTGDMKKMEEIFGQVADSAGATEEAFATWAESMGAENARAFADLQVALIELGDVIAPIAADLLGFAAAVAKGFGDLPGPVQAFVLGLAAAAAAAGPLVTAGGKLMSAWSAASRVIDNWTSAGGRAFADAMNSGSDAAGNLEAKTGRLSGRFGVLKGAVGVAGAAGAVFGLVAALDQIQAQKRAQELEEFAEAFIAMGDDIDEATVSQIRSVELMRDLDLGIGSNTQFRPLEAMEQFEKLLDVNVEAAARFIETAEAADVAGSKIDQMRDMLEQKRQADVQGQVDAENYNAEVKAGAEAMGEAEGAAEGSTEAIADQEQAVNEAAEAYRDYADTVRGAVDPVFGLMDALRGNEEAQRGVIEAQAALDQAIQEHGLHSAEAASAAVALQDAIIGVGTSAADVTSAAANLNAAVAENPALVDSALSALQTWRDQGIIPTDEQLRFLQDQIRQTALQGVALGDVDPEISVTERGSRTARERFAQVEHAIRRIPTSRNTSVTTSGTQYAVGQLDSVARAINRVSSRGNVHVSVGGGGGQILHEGGIVRGPRGHEVAAVLLGQEEVLAYDDPRHSANLGRMTALAQPMVSAASLVGGNVTNIYNVDLRGLITPDHRKFRTAVVDALNTAGRKGRGVNAA
jgi:TP901 family phage tail tape measure protein